MNNVKFMPDQQTSRKTKTNPKFYKPVAEYCLGISNVINGTGLKDAYDLVNNKLDDSKYTKILNPYNSHDEKYKRFPADLRNYDMTADIVRRYMGEFIKQTFEYSVHSHDPEMSVRFNTKLQQEISNIASSTFVDILNTTMQNQQAASNSNQPQPIPDIPDFEEVVKSFMQTYVDEMAIEGQKALDIIMDMCDAVTITYDMFYHYIVTGVAITYRDIKNGKFYKECIHPSNFTSLGSGKYIKDHDICKRRFSCSPNDLLTNFADVFDDKLIADLKKVFKDEMSISSSVGSVEVPLSFYRVNEDNTLIDLTKFNLNDTTSRSLMLANNREIEGVHITFKTQVPIYYVQRFDPATGNLFDVVIEEDTYSLNPVLNDITVQKDWITEVWEMYCFGAQGERLISKPRPIAYQCKDESNIKDSQQPYNGIYELIYGTGYTFSIPVIIAPFQTFRNILFYAREKTIARNKDMLLLLPKSILGKNDEETLYRMEAAGLLVYDDSLDETSQKAANIRSINLSLSNYINVLDTIIDNVKTEAWDLVDMNRQRYGDIVASDGKGTTQEAIVRSSMGSVLIYTMFDKLLEQDYLLDLNYSKVLLAGESTVNVKIGNSYRPVPFNSASHIMAAYSMTVRNSKVDEDKYQKLEAVLQGMSQNGDGEAAAAGIFASNISELQQLIRKFSQANRDFQMQLEQQKLDAQKELKQLEIAYQQNEFANERAIAEMKEQHADYRKSLELQLTAITSLQGTSDDSTGMVNQLNSLLKDITNMNDMKKHNDDIKYKYDKMHSDEKIAKMNKN